MAPRDGDENRKPRHLAAQPIAPAADESDGEDNDIVDDDIVDNDIVDNDDDNDDDNEDDSEEDSDEMESANEEEDPVQREIRKQRVRTETAEIMAEKMEQDLMYQKILWMTEDIKQATKAKQDELKQLREARRVWEEEEAIGGAGANHSSLLSWGVNPEPNPDPSPWLLEQVWNIKTHNLFICSTEWESSI